MTQCAICGKDATCLGRYDTMTADAYACDDCCGHGCEDGFCVFLEDLPGHVGDIGDALAEASETLRSQAEELRLLRELEKNRRAAADTPITHLQGHIDLHDQEDVLLVALDRHREGSQPKPRQLPQCENPDHMVTCTCAADARLHREGK